MTKSNTPDAATIAGQVDLVDALIRAIGEEEGPQYIDSLDGAADGDISDETIEAAKKLGLVTVFEADKDSTIELTQAGKKVLAQLSKAPKKTLRKKNEKPKTQEVPVAKTDKAEKKVKTKVKAEVKDNGPTYGIDIHRNSVPTRRWIIADTLMALTAPTTAEQVAKKVAARLEKDFGMNLERTIAKIKANAKWLTRNSAKGFVGLTKPAKAEKPAKVKAEKPAKAAKPAKPKAEKKAAAADILG